jgi:CHAT domain-containing protein
VLINEFEGVWISDAFGEITLMQQQQTVTGSYAGRGNGRLQGSVRNERLDFTWQDQHDSAKGKGFLRAVSGGRTLVGFWSIEGDNTSQESLIAELLTRLTSVPTVDPQDAIEIKYAGYNLVLAGKYDQALPLLESSLQIYQDRLNLREQEGHVQEGTLIDVVNIIRRLLECYFSLADYQNVPQHTATVQQRDTFYTKLLSYLNMATTIYQMMLSDIFQHHTSKIIKVITKDRKTLYHWKEQFSVVATQLGLEQQAEQESHILCIQALNTLLTICDEHLAEAQRIFTMLNTQTLSKTAMILQSLLEIRNYLEIVEKQVTSDIEQLQALSNTWPADQRTLVMEMSLLLQMLPLKLQGERKLIALTEEQTDGRVKNVWESTFRLSGWLERWRVRLRKDMERIEAQERGQTFFCKLIQFFVDMGSGTDAWVISERARARAFIDLLAARAPQRENLAIGVAEQSEVAAPVTLTELLEIVQRRRGVVIEYFVTEEQLIIWVISSQGDVITLTSPISQQRLRETIADLLNLLQRPALQRKQRTSMFQRLQELYGCLLAPIPHELLPTDAEEAITIIPHGPLFQVPFAALQEAATCQYFIQQHALIYAPSVHILKYIQANTRNIIFADSPSLLAFVNPVPLPGLDQSSLIFTEQKFGVIEAFYNQSERNTILKGGNALKAALWREAARHTVLYFATHAQAFDEDPLASYLALACVPSEEDGYLRVPEIFQLDLHTDLVILSACETGRGQITGDGINGLSRAFITAGTPSLLISLWPIPEEESFNQMYQFYEAWQTEQRSKAQALRMAQLESLENYPEQPAVWSAFALVGE